MTLSLAESRMMGRVRVVGTLCGAKWLIPNRHPRIFDQGLAVHDRASSSGSSHLEAPHLYAQRIVQDPVLFTGTIAENIGYGLEGVSRAEIEHAARQANCEFIWDMPLGFDTTSTCI